MRWSIPYNILIDPPGKMIDRRLRSKALHTRLEQLIGEKEKLFPIVA